MSPPWSLVCASAKNRIYPYAICTRCASNRVRAPHLGAKLPVSLHHCYCVDKSRSKLMQEGQRGTALSPLSDERCRNWVIPAPRSPPECTLRKAVHSRSNALNAKRSENFSAARRQGNRAALPSPTVPLESRVVSR